MKPEAIMLEPIGGETLNYLTIIFTDPRVYRLFFHYRWQEDLSYPLCELTHWSKDQIQLPDCLQPDISNRLARQLYLYTLAPQRNWQLGTVHDIYSVQHKSLYLYRNGLARIDTRIDPDLPPNAGRLHHQILRWRESTETFDEILKPIGYSTA